MKAKVVLDDELFNTAKEFTGITGKSELLHKALQALVHIEASRKLAALGGTMPELKDIPRTRADRL
jgi:Arc/MetJ family transcription regulator